MTSWLCAYLLVGAVIAALVYVGTGRRAPRRGAPKWVTAVALAVLWLPIMIGVLLDEREK